MKDREIIHSPDADTTLPTEKASHAAPGETAASPDLVRETALKFGTDEWESYPRQGRYTVEDYLKLPKEGKP